MHFRCGCVFFIIPAILSQSASEMAESAESDAMNVHDGGISLLFIMPESSFLLSADAETINSV